MGSISYLPKARGARSRPRDDLDDLRSAFNAQMQRERVRLVMLSAALARTEGDAAHIYDDLITRAHRLQSGAEILECDAIATAANDLQQAAYRASLAHADNTDASVWTALITLVTLLGTLEARR